MSRYFIVVIGFFMTIGILSVGKGNLAQANTSQLFVSNPITGVAIDGFDPVSYFTDFKARKGKQGFELEWKQAHWQFTNAANRDRFKEAPGIYAPCFNGYGAYAMKRGVLVEGNPQIWAIYNNRLFFFHTVEARSRWAKEPETFLDEGLANWKQLKSTLVRG